MPNTSRASEVLGPRLVLAKSQVPSSIAWVQNALLLRSWHHLRYLVYALQFFPFIAVRSLLVVRVFAELYLVIWPGADLTVALAILRQSLYFILAL